MGMKQVRSTGNSYTMAGQPHRQSIMGRLLSLWLLVALLFAPALEAEAQNKQQRIKELQNKQQTLKGRQAELRRKRHEKMRQAAKVQQGIVQNQRRLESSRHSLSQHQRRLDETRSRLVWLDGKLDQATGEAVRLSGDAGKRLRSMYMGERLSMLQMVLEANDVATLIDRLYYKKRIVAQDRQLLADLKQKIQELNGLKVELARQKAQIAQTIQTIQAHNMEIQRSIEVDRALRDRLQNDARFYERAENELLAVSSSITNEIRGLSGNKSFQQVTGSTGVFIWPISGPITSGFGTRVHPIHRTRKMHTGLDIAGPNRGPIKAADGGQVIFAGWKGGYGKCVMINHGNRNGKNLVTLYGHMSGLSVSRGQNVSKGQVIGYEGSTGYSTGPHLHFEVRVDGAPVDPRGYL